LREFTRVGADPRMLVLDAREPVPGLPSLDNAFFGARRLPAHADPVRLAQAISGRHVVIVADDEERGLDLCHVLDELEVTAWALEGGAAGWSDALVAHACDAYDRGERVVVLEHPAADRLFFLATKQHDAVAVGPSGSVPAILEIARHHGCTLAAVVETTPPGAEHPASCAAALARASGAPLIAAPLDEARAIAGFRLRLAPDGGIRVAGAGYTIGCAAGDTYRVGVSDRRPSRA